MAGSRGYDAGHLAVAACLGMAWAECISEVSNRLAHIGLAVVGGFVVAFALVLARVVLDWLRTEAETD
jgi:hypothetical protein